MSSATRPHGPPTGPDHTRRPDEGGTASPGKARQAKRRKEDQDTDRQPKRRANAESTFDTRHILPGYRKRLPAEAQELVESALLDDDLADAPADDPRWVQLYEDLHRLVDPSRGAPASVTSTNSSTAAAHTDDSDDAHSSFEWASDSDKDVATSPALRLQTNGTPDLERQAYFKSLPPQPDLTAAVHRYTSASLCDKRGKLPPNTAPASWDPSSLAALGMLVEEIARSQARFNAQRTMFAKSPRNQALAAKKKEEREKKQEGQMEQKEQKG